MSYLVEQKAKMADRDVLRKKLRKQVYNAAMRCIDQRYRSDSEAVKIFRDAEAVRQWGKPECDLTNAELANFLNILTKLAHEIEKDVVPIYASPWQLKNLRFYAVGCALHYCSFKNFQVTDHETGEITEGEELRKQLIANYESKSQMLPNNIFILLYKNWINPKTHEFMQSKGYEKFSKNPEAFYYEKLDPEQAQYLISRYMQIYNNVQKVKPSNNFDIRSN